MIKILSLLISFSLLFSSIAPSYAQALDAVSRQRLAVQPLPTDAINTAVSREMQQIQFHQTQAQFQNRQEQYKSVKEEVDFAVALLTSNQSEYELLKEKYFNPLLKEQLALLEKEYKNERLEFQQILEELNADRKEALSATEIASYCEGATDPSACEQEYKAFVEEAYNQNQITWINKRAQLDKWYKEQKQKLPQDLEAAFKAKLAEYGITTDKLSPQQEQAKSDAGVNYLKNLAHQIHQEQYYNLMVETYPLFHSIGALNEKDRAWAAAELRDVIQMAQNDCEAPGFVNALLDEMGIKDVVKSKLNGCEEILKAASALTIIGKGDDSNSNDEQYDDEQYQEAEDNKEVLSTLFEKGQDWAMAPAVIMTAGIGLITLGFPGRLIGILHKKATEQVPSIQITLSLFSIEDWTHMFRTMTQGDEWLGYNEQASMYPIGDGKQNSTKGTRSAYSDLGMYLALEAMNGNKTAQNSLDSQFKVFIKTDGSQLHILFPAFVEGVLASGYQIPDYILQGSVSQRYLGQDGEGWGRFTTVDDRPAWANFRKNLEKNHLDITGYVIGTLYSSAKSDLDPWSRLIINNELAKAYKQQTSRPVLEGLAEKNAPTQAEIDNYTHWESKISGARKVDLVLTVIGILTLGYGLIKGFAGGASSLSKLARTIRIARASQGAARGAAGISGLYQGTVRVGRLLNHYKLVRVNQLANFWEIKNVMPQVPAKEIRQAIKIKSPRIQARALKKQGKNLRHNIVKATEAHDAQVAQMQAASDAKFAQKNAQWAQAAANEAAQNAAKAAPSAPIKVTHQPRPVKNALGQTVTQYVPIEPQPVLSKPSLARSFTSYAKEWWLWKWTGASDMFGSVAQSFRTKMGIALLSSGLTFTPLNTTVLKTANIVKTEYRIAKAANTVEKMTIAPRFVNPIAAGASDAASATRGTATITRVAHAPTLKAPVSKAGLSLNLPFNSSLPISSVLFAGAFVPVAVDSRAERWLQMGRFFDFKNDKPQFLQDYLKEVNLYQKQLAANPGYEGQQISNRLAQLTHDYQTGYASMRMEYNRKDYPITGAIYGGFKTLSTGFYLNYVAPKLYGNNSFYQNQPVNHLFQHGLIQESVAHSLGKQATPSTVKPVLSMNGLGTLSARVEDYFSKKQASSSFYTYAQKAQEQTVRDLGTVEEINPVEYASILVNAFGQLVHNDKKLSATQKDNFVRSFKAEVQTALNTGDLVTDDVLVSFPRGLRKYVGNHASILVSYITEKYQNKDFRVAAKYHFIRTASQYKNPTLAQEKSNLIAQRILREEAPKRESFVWIMASAADESHKLQAYYRLLASGYEPATVEEIIQTHLGLNKNSELVTKLSNEEAAALQTAQRLSISQTENLMEAVPASEQLFAVGFDEADLLQINEQKLNYVLYSAQDVLPVMNLMETVDPQGNRNYKNYLPVYLRYQDGNLSPRPLIYMTVTTKQGFNVPAGFVVAVDEKGQWKYVPVNLRQAQSAGHLMATWPVVGKLFNAQNNANKMLASSREERRIIMESNLKTSELQALLMQLRKGQGTTADKYVAVLRMAEPDKFEAMMNEVALVAGADLGASLSSQFKKTLNSSSLSILFSGFGYISPLIANLFKPLINTFGAYRTLQVGLMAMVGVSTLGMFNGMWGYFTLPATFGAAYIPVLSFLATAIIVASVFSTIASPVLKSAYPDQVVFASKNLSFTTTKGLSRMLVGLIPIIAMWLLNNPTIHEGINQALSVVGTTLPDQKLNWSLLTPIVGLVSAIALWNLQHSRLKTEEKARLAELKNTPEGQKSVVKRIGEAYAAKDPQSIQRERDFKEIFVPKMRDIANRLGQIYMAYAPVNSVFIGLAAGILFEPSTALTITMLGSFMNYMARKGFNWLLKNKIITDDQLTGLLLPVMAASIAAVFAMPYTTLAGTSLQGLMLIPWWMMQIATSTFGVAESSRMQNLVAQYYKDERERVRSDETLTEAQREAKLKELKATESDMKMNAAKLYNKNNSKGILTILAMIAAAYVMTEATWLPWVSQEAAKDSILLLQVLRASLLPSVILGAILNIKNKDMVKEGLQWMTQLKLHLTQEIIDRGDPTEITKSLKMNLSRLKTTKNQLTTLSEELLTETRGYANSLTSEKRISGLLARAILLNDRLKVFVDNVPNGAEQVKVELMNLRMISYNLHVLLDGNGIKNSLDRVEGNDVSSVLRQQAEQFFDSVRGLEFVSDEQVHQFMDKLREIRQNSADETMISLILTLQTYLQNMDAENFDKAFKVLSNKVKDPQFTAQGKEISNLLKGNTPAVMNANLNYLPELLNNRLVKINNYEKALDAKRELNTIMNEYRAGKIYDGILEDIEIYYQQAIQALNDYLKDNANLLNEQTDPRVQQIRQEVESIYQEFFKGTPHLNKSPTSKVPKTTTPAPALSYAPTVITSALIQGALLLGAPTAQAITTAEQPSTYIQQVQEDHALHTRHTTNPYQFSPTYALPATRFLIGTESNYSHQISTEKYGLDANRPGLEGFKAWIAQFVKKRSTGLDWGTLQELHALYAEALVGNTTHLSLMNEATQALMGEQNDKFYKIKFLNAENQHIAELIYTADGFLSLRPAQEHHFYAIEESPLSLQTDQAKAIEGIKISKDGRVILKKTVTAQAIQQLLDRLVTDLKVNYPQAITQVRMGNHEFGIQSTGLTRRFYTGNLHIHIEFTLPQEEKIISYTIGLDAHALTDNNTLSAPQLVQTYQTLFKGIYKHVNWPTHTHPQVLTLSLDPAVSQAQLPPANLPTAAIPTLSKPDALTLSQQLQKTKNFRITPLDKQALKAEAKAAKSADPMQFPVLNEILAKSFPFILMQGPQINHSEELINYLSKSFPLIRYDQSSVKKGLSLLRPNQENMVWWLSHGTIVNGRKTRNHKWISNTYNEQQQLSTTDLREILETIEQYHPSLTHLVLWTCLSGQALEDFMKLSKEHSDLTQRVHVYIPNGVYELRTNDLVYYGRGVAPSYMADILNRFRYSIDHGIASTLAQKVIINGHVTEPLAITIKRIQRKLSENEETPMSHGMVQFYEMILDNLNALRAISLARTPRSLKKALLHYAQLNPGYVILNGKPYEDVAEQLPAPINYIWGTEAEIFDIYNTDHYKKTAILYFEPELANLVAAVAQEEYTSLQKFADTTPLEN